VSPVEEVLQQLVEEYYRGCKTYAAARRPDSSERVFWRITLGALQRYGSLLADALGQAEPDWEFMHEQAEEDARRARLVAYASIPRDALKEPLKPVLCLRCSKPVGECGCHEEWFERAEPVTIPQGSDRTVGSDG
jgi:hypothetical protein